MITWRDIHIYIYIYTPSKGFPYLLVWFLVAGSSSLVVFGAPPGSPPGSRGPEAPPRAYLWPCLLARAPLLPLGLLSGPLGPFLCPSGPCLGPSGPLLGPQALPLALLAFQLALRPSEYHILALRPLFNKFFFTLTPVEHIFGYIIMKKIILCWLDSPLPVILSYNFTS